MKTCIKCKTPKPLEEYHTQSDRKGGTSYCKACLHRYQMDRWIRTKEKAMSYKGSVCNHCNQAFPYPAMQFHHRDPLTKDVNWSKLRLRSWDKIKFELDKCDLLCANCHSIVHSNLSS